MALQNRMELQFRQEMTINPRLYQAMDLLQMPMLDLQMHLKQELMVNPFLEIAEEAEEGIESSAEEDETEDSLDEPEVLSPDETDETSSPEEDQSDAVAPEEADRPTASSV